MRVRPNQLVIWSFLMASAHGAGLMVIPFVLGHSASQHQMHGPGAATSGHESHLALEPIATVDGLGLLPTLIHTVGYLAVAGLVAILVYEKLGLRLLSRAWINLNLFWAIALIITAVLTPLL